MPGTLQAADATIKKLEDFMSTMDANGERIRGLLEAGRQLVSEGNIHAEKIREKADSIEKRHGKNQEAVQQLLGRLRENREQQHFLQDCHEVRLSAPACPLRHSLAIPFPQRSGSLGLE